MAEPSAKAAKYLAGLETLDGMWLSLSEEEQLEVNGGLKEVFISQDAKLRAELEAAQASVVELRAMVQAQIDETARARGRIAELEAQNAQLVQCCKECQLDVLETRIARAVAELENHALPLCSEEGEIEHAVKRTLEALR